MKALMGLVFLFSVAAGACPAPEAQFVAVVSDVTPLNNRECLIEFSQIKAWQENPMCPLDAELAMTAIVSTFNCSLKVGDDASGVLVQQRDGSLKF